MDNITREIIKEKMDFCFKSSLEGGLSFDEIYLSIKECFDDVFPEDSLEITNLVKEVYCDNLKGDFCDEVKFWYE